MLIEINGVKGVYCFVNLDIVWLFLVSLCERRLGINILVCFSKDGWAIGILYCSLWWWILLVGLRWCIVWSLVVVFVGLLGLILLLL